MNAEHHVQHLEMQCKLMVDHVTGLHKSDQQYMTSAKMKARKPEEEFLYATTASKRAERQRLVRFIRSAVYSAAVCCTTSVPAK